MRACPAGRPEARTNARNATHPAMTAKALSPDSAFWTTVVW